MSAIYLVNRHDYLLARAALGERLAHTELITHAADVYHLMLSEGLTQVHFVDVVPLDAGTLANCHYEADRLARAFDAELAELRSRHLHAPVATPGWDYLNVYFLALTTLRWRHFAPLLAASLPPAPALAYFYLTNAQDYYFDSALQRQFLQRALLQRGGRALKEVHTENHRPFMPEAMQFELELDDVAAGAEALVHLPTVYYDYAAHQARLAQRHGERVLDLHSPYFDIPITSRRIGLRHTGVPRPASLAEQAYAEAVRERTTVLFAVLDTDAALVPAQVTRQVSRSLSQWRAFNQLCTAPALAGITHLYLSDHDAGLSGPLAAWANLRAVQTEIHPHSAMTIAPFPVIAGAVKHGYARPPGAYLDLGVGSSRWVAPLVAGTPAAARPQPLVLLAYNALIDPGGVPTEAFQRIAEFTYDVLRVCQAGGVRCMLRSKATWDFTLPLLQHLRARGMDGAMLDALFAQGPMSDWPARTSVYLGVDQVSSALHQFYAQGVSCIQAFERGYSEPELYILPATGVQATDYPGALRLLQAMFPPLPN